MGRLTHVIANLPKPEAPVVNIPPHPAPVINVPQQAPPVIPPIDLTPVAKAIDHMAQVVATLKPEKDAKPIQRIPSEAQRHPPKNKKRRHEFTYDETGKKWMVTSENEE